MVQEKCEIWRLTETMKCFLPPSATTTWSPSFWSSPPSSFKRISEHDDDLLQNKGNFFWNKTNHTIVDLSVCTEQWKRKSNRSQELKLIGMNSNCSSWSLILAWGLRVTSSHFILFSCPEQLNRWPCPLLAWSVTTNNQSLHNTTEWL